MARALGGKKAGAAVDRRVCFGWDTGPMYREALADSGWNLASFSASGGLGGADIALQDFARVIEALAACKDKPGRHKTLWLEKPL